MACYRRRAQSRLLSVAGGQVDPDAAKALWAAVLARAVDDYRYSGNNKESLAYRKDARQWVRCTDYVGVGSFNYVCEVLNLDPDAVRDRLKR